MLWLHAIANPSVTCEDWCHEPCILCRVILPGRSVVCVVCVEVWLWGLPGNNYQHMHTCHTYDMLDILTNEEFGFQEDTPRN
jgi:hypothetical protein